MKPWGVAALSAISVGLPSVPAFAESAVGPIYITTCAACAGAASFLTLRTSKSKTEIERSAVFEAAMGPLSKRIGKILERPQEFEQERDGVLARLVEVAGEIAHPRALSALYWLAPDGGSLDLAIVNQPAKEAGMPETFADTNKGRFLLAIARSTGEAAGDSASGRYVQDYAKDPDSKRIYMTDDCKTALFKPVRTGSTSHGLLVLQAQKAGHIPAGLEDDERLNSVVNLIGFMRQLQIPAARRRDVPGQSGDPVVQT